MVRTGTHHKTNRDWTNHVREDAATYANEIAILAVLMDIRAELRGINETLDCRNTRDIPVRLKAIDRRLKAMEPKK